MLSYLALSGARVLRVATLLGMAVASLLLFGCGARRATAEEVMHLKVDASRVVGRVEPLWGDHYDLSMTHLGHLDEPAFRRELARLKPRTLRCSVGRWEVGHEPPEGATSDDPAVLGRVEREYYRGPDDLAAADDPRNYAFDYLDRQLAAVREAGFEPFLSFDYMPLTLARVRTTASSGNVFRKDAKMSFSNGVRTSPPAHPEVFARVVRNVVRHLFGRFGEGGGGGVNWIEVGNEPDLTGPGGEPMRIFWNGSRQDFLEMYAAVAREVDADRFLRQRIRLGAGSFGLMRTERSPTFTEEFLTGVATRRARLDFLSYHSYDDAPAAHLSQLAFVAGAMADAGVEAEIVNGEWGRNLQGLNVIYERVDFGLFRARVMNLMQRFGVRMAHEALLKDPWRVEKMFGMLRAGGAPAKPVAAVYQALTRLEALEVRFADEGGCEGCVLAAGDQAGGRLTVVYLDGGDLTGMSHPVELAVEGLSPREEKARVRRLELDDARFEDRRGLVVEEDREVRVQGGRLVLSAAANPGGPRLLLWEIEGAAVPGARRIPARAEVRARALAAWRAGERERGALRSQEAVARARSAEAEGDEGSALELRRAAYEASARELRELEPTPTREFQTRLEGHRKLWEALAARYRERRQGDETLALVRSMRETMADLMTRARPPMNAGLFQGFMKVSVTLYGVIRQHGSAEAARRLAADTRARAEAAFGEGSAQVRVVERAMGG